MSVRSISRRALTVVVGTTLSTFAIGAQADPISLQAVCHLTSIVAGQGKCELFYELSDDFSTPASIRKAQVKVNGIIVAQYVNDVANPVAFSVATVSGSTSVACGASHTVTAVIARVTPPNSTYEAVGSLPVVACPTAP
jgi:hypothetical protein